MDNWWEQQDTDDAWIEQQLNEEEISDLKGRLASIRAWAQVRVSDGDWLLDQSTLEGQSNG